MYQGFGSYSTPTTQQPTQQQFQQGQMPPQPQDFQKQPPKSQTPCRFGATCQRRATCPFQHQDGGHAQQQAFSGQQQQQTFQGYQGPKLHQTGPKPFVKQPCKFGPTCKQLAQGTCTWLHESQPQKQQNQQQKPQKFGQQQQIQQHLQPQFGTSQKPHEEHKGDKCSHFIQGNCLMVRCKNKHIFCGIDFHLKNTFTIAAKGVSITSCCLMDLNGAEQLLITTSNQQATILKLPDLAQTADFKLSSPASTCFTTTQCPNTIFLGLQSAGQYGQTLTSIQMVIPGREILEPNAHAGPITAFEFASIGGQQVLFSASIDGFVKAWDASNASNPAFQKLNKLLEKNYGNPVLSLKLTKPDFLVIGLSDGMFSGWNLSKNSFDDLKAHQGMVQALHLHDKFLISSGQQEIQVRETDGFSVVLQGQVKQYPQLGTFKTLALIPAGAYPNPIVVAGDAEGFITLLTINSNGQPETVSFGAHNDLKEVKAHVMKVFVFNTPGSAPILCSLDNVGRLRLWTE